MINLVPVDSSVIESVGYDPEDRILQVVFCSGNAYEYRGVPGNVYEGLMEAESKGKYMNENIVDVYPFEKC